MGRGRVSRWSLVKEVSEMGKGLTDSRSNETEKGDVFFSGPDDVAEGSIPGSRVLASEPRVELRK